ncbi:MAG TPA: hypothetical protein VGO47_13200, partial [Chlamydiales bacterium]|nr:hypothetical protein [Chlamydiales bacterium]
PDELEIDNIFNPAAQKKNLKACVQCADEESPPPALRIMMDASGVRLNVSSRVEIVRFSTIAFTYTGITH